MKILCVSGLFYQSLQMAQAAGDIKKCIIIPADRSTSGTRFCVPTAYQMNLFDRGFAIGMVFPSLQPEAPFGPSKDDKLTVIITDVGLGPSLYEQNLALSKQSDRVAHSYRAGTSTVFKIKKGPTLYFWGKSTTLSDDVLLSDWGLPGVDIYHLVSNEYQVHILMNRRLLEDRNDVDKNVSALIKSFQQ